MKLFSIINFAIHIVKLAIPYDHFHAGIISSFFYSEKSVLLDFDGLELL